MAKSKPLSIKQKTFVLEYLSHGNATRAAIAAGYSEHSAKQRGWSLLANPRIREQVSRHGKKLEMKADDVRKRYDRIAAADPLKVFSWDENGKVSIVASEDIDDDTRAAIAGVRQAFDQQGRPILQIEWHDAKAALAQIAKFEGMEKQDPAAVHLHQNNVNVDLDSMSTEELKAIKKVMETPELAPLRKILVPLLEAGRPVEEAPPGGV